MHANPASADHIRHVEILRQSYRHWTGLDLIDPELTPTEAASMLWHAPFAVVSHGIEADPIFNYANQLALQLFEMNWEEFTTLPSRLSAEPLNQTERARLLQTVARQGLISDYSGIRTGKSGQRFYISNATVWNLMDETGRNYGQAALIKSWHML